MPIYRVIARSTDYPSIEIEAADADEAMDKAAEIDGGEFTPDDDFGDWEIIRAEEV
jgi:hypothetical protein